MDLANVPPFRHHLVPFAADRESILCRNSRVIGGKVYALFMLVTETSTVLGAVYQSLSRLGGEAEIIHWRKE
jgi:hypothetical protein